MSFLEGELVELSCSKGRLEEPVEPEEALFIHEDELPEDPEAELLLLLSPLLLLVKFIFSNILLVLAR